MKFTNRREKGFGGKKLPKQFRVAENNITTLQFLSKLYNRSESELINEILLVESCKKEILEEILKKLNEKSFCNVFNTVPIFMGYITQNNYDMNGVITNTTTYVANEYIRLNFNFSATPGYKYFVSMERRIDYQFVGGNVVKSDYLFGNQELIDDIALMSLLESFNWILEKEFLRIE